MPFPRPIFTRFCCLYLLLLGAWLPISGQNVVHGLSNGKGLSPISKDARARKFPPPDSMVAKWAARATAEGWAEFGLDSVVGTSGNLHYFFHQGPRYFLRSLNIARLSPDEAHQAGLDPTKKTKPFSWATINAQLRSVLMVYQNQGYPFASFNDLQVHYEPQGTDSLWVSLDYSFSLGPQVVIDSVIVVGDIRESAKFVQSLTRIRPGIPYNQKLVQDIPRVLNNSIYYQDVKNPQVAFTPLETAVLRIQVKQQQSGRFDLLAGILPPAVPGGKFQFSGLLDVLMVSPFRQGDVIEIQYNQLPGGSQRAHVRASWPMILRTPVKAEGELKLFKQAEDFFNVNLEGKIGYAFSPFLEARFFYQSRSTRLLDIAPLLADTLTNPDQISGSRKLAGVGFQFENLDFRQNPSRGWSATATFGLGTRTIELDRRLPEVLLTTLFGTDAVKEIETHIRYFYPIGKRQVLHVAQHLYWLDQNYYFRNDQIQLGGARTIRGYNENQFFANFYAQLTAEYRFRLDQSSYLFGFTDLAYLEDKVKSLVYRPRGIGLGMTYGTKAGILSISYAVGHEPGLGFQPTRGKIHIGLVNVF